MDGDNAYSGLYYFTDLPYRINVCMTAGVKIGILAAKYVVDNMPDVLVYLLRLVFEIPVPHGIDKFEVRADVLELPDILSLADSYRSQKTVRKQFLSEIAFSLNQCAREIIEFRFGSSILGEDV